MEQNRTQKGRELAVHKSTHKASERSAIWAQTEGGKRFGGGVSQATQGQGRPFKDLVAFLGKMEDEMVLA